MKKTKQTAKSSDTQKQSRRARVYIVGDTPMVEEYARLCAAHGYEVFVEWNEVPARLPSFDSAKITRARKIPPGIALALELTNLDLVRKRRNIELLDKALPPNLAIVSSSVTVSATEQSTWLRYRNRLVGAGVLPTLIDKPIVEVAPTVFSPKETVEVVQRFFHSVGKQAMIVQDRVGLVFPRILCHVINEASFAMQEQIATPGDLDTAAKLAMGFPAGPLGWADRIGLRHVVAVLCAIQQDLQEDRYRIAPLLRQLAQSGVWWKQMS